MLPVHGIGAVVFEGEASPDARTQGGTLDIHLASGQHPAGAIRHPQILALRPDERMELRVQSGFVQGQRMCRGGRFAQSEPLARGDADRS
ncbi:MAG: hypothetical protein WA324_10135 [Bryobacteraceae bacterium]